MNRNKIALMSILCLVVLSCSTTKSYQRTPIYGSKYEITSVINTDKEKPQLVCVVYDRNEHGEPLEDGIVEYDFKSKIITDMNGRVEFEMPVGKYKIKADCMGCESIKTNYINFEPYTKTEIKFELGKEDDSMGLPPDYGKKSSKYKGPVY